MAITAQNASYLGSAPVAGGSTTVAFGGSSMLELAYIGKATFTGDGATTTATLNYLDGTNTLFFTPSAVFAVRSGGSAASTISVASVADNADSGKTAAVNFSAAPANAATVTVVFFIMK